MGKSLFQGLSREELGRLTQKKELRHYKRRENIFHPGTKPLGLFCISSGQVKVYQTGIEGRDQIVRLAQEGDAIGYRALLSGEEYSACAEALEDTQLCFIDRPTLFELMDDKPLLLRRIMTWLCQDLRSAEERLRIFAQKTAAERIAETLILLSETFGKTTNSGIKLNIRLTRQEIAELAGTVLETAVRHLSEFKQRRWIKFEGRSIFLQNLPALKKAAHLD